MTPSRLLALAVGLLAFLAVLAAAVGLSTAQEDDSEEKSRFVRFLEEQISTPDLQISIGSIDGVLSSDVRIASITISDRQGEYFRIENAHLVWSRLALLRGRLDIDLLEADRIAYLRGPVASGPPDPAASGFAVPELPVEVVIDQLRVPQIVLGEPVLGFTATLSADGSINLAGGALDADLAIVRTDGPGGRFAIDAAYANETGQLDLDLDFSEPADGVVSNLIGIPGRPAIGLRIAGSGPIENFAADIALSASGEQLVSGRATVTAANGGYRFVTDIDGNLAPLVPPAYADYVRGASRLRIDATRDAAGAVALSELNLTSGVLALSVDGALAPDGFPTRIRIDGRAGGAGEGPVVLPGEGAGSIGGGTFQVSFGGPDERWSAVFDVTDFQTEQLTAGRARIEAGGIAENLQTPEARRLTFDVAGDLSGITAPSAELMRAIGDAVTFAAAGRWQAGEDVVVDSAVLKNPNAALNFAGTIGTAVNGRYRLNAASIEPFSGLAGQSLAGALDVALEGTIAPVGGGFDLDVDGRAEQLSVGIPAVDPLLAGTTVLNGRAVRDQEGLRFDALRLSNPQAEVRLDGAYDLARADLTLAARLADIATVVPEAGGAVTLDARLTGNGEAPDLAASLQAPSLRLAGKTLSDAAVRFDGTLAGADVDGRVTGTATLEGVPLALRADVATEEDGTRRLSDLAFTAADTRVTGTLALLPGGLADGRLQIASPDISVVAPLALLEGRGSVNADVTLSPQSGEQAARATAAVRALEIAGVRVASADIDVTAADLLGRPVIDGRIAADRVEVAGVTVAEVTATAARRGEEAFAIDARASVEGGTVTASGTIGDTLSIAAAVEALPAALANGFVPDLAAAGTISGQADISGTPDAPVVAFQVRGTGLTAAPLRTAGVDPLTVDAEGRLENQAVRLTATAGNAGGLDLAARGTVPLAGSGLDVSVTGSAPLALANGLLAERGARLAGTARLDARASGSIEAPVIAGTATVDDATFTDPETGNRLTGIDLTLRFDGDTATIERFNAATPRGGSLTGRGAIGLTGERPVDASLTLDNAAFSLGDLARGVASGTVTANGVLGGTLTLGGRIVIDRAEITVPESLPSQATLLDVRHVRPPPNVRRTLERAQLATRARTDAAAAEGGTNIVLDVTVSAPARIFVRGRGIDAELGGEVRLTGPVSSISPVGAFELRRGRLDIIGQRITFDRGSVTLVGDFDPLIDFSATTRTNRISVTASVTGPVSDPAIVLSSDPELPQDEILAQFLFGRSINDLSPVQIARLATAVAQLAGGGGGPDLLGRLRASTGLDDLDVVTDESGNAAVQAGRYVTENIYLGVTAGGDGQSRVSVNLDITDNLKARAEVGADAGTRAGIYYEKEY